MTEKNRQNGNESVGEKSDGLARDIEAREAFRNAERDAYLMMMLRKHISPVAVDYVSLGDVPTEGMKRFARGLQSDARTQGFEDCIFAIRGAIAFGIRGTNAPPDGHWLAEFYDIGKELARPAPEALGAAKWQPIETAPKNEDVLVYAAGSQYVAWFQNDETDPYREDGDPESDLNNLWCVTDNKHGPYALRGSKPSHWMYLPHDPAKDQS